MLPGILLSLMLKSICLFNLFSPNTVDSFKGLSNIVNTDSYSYTYVDVKEDNDRGTFSCNSLSHVVFLLHIGNFMRVPSSC